MKLCNDCIQEVKVVEFIQNNGDGWGADFQEIEERTGVHRRRVKQIVDDYDMDVDEGARKTRVMAL